MHVLQHEGIHELYYISYTKYTRVASYMCLSIKKCRQYNYKLMSPNLNCLLTI